MTIRFTYSIDGEINHEELTSDDMMEFVDFQMMLMQEGCRLLRMERVSEVNDVQ